MPSRKRTRGKARKAARAQRHPLPQSCQLGQCQNSKPPEPILFWSQAWLEGQFARNDQQHGRHERHCMHGKGFPNYAPAIFVGAFEKMINKSLTHGKTLIEAIIESFPIIAFRIPLDNRNFREWLKSMYLWKGTNSVCLGSLLVIRSKSSSPTARV